jgi:hypothetical protein
MNDRNKQKTNTPKVATKVVENATLNDNPEREINSAAGIGGSNTTMPNSAASTAVSVKNGKVASRPAGNSSAKVKVSKGKAPKVTKVPKKSDDVSNRIAKLEAIIEAQADQNQTFQHSILEAMSGMMGCNATNDDANDDMTAHANASTSHPISDGEEELPPSQEEDEHLSLSLPSTSSSVKTGEKQADEPEPEKTAPQLEEEEGFASMFSPDTDIGGTIRADVAKSFNSALVDVLEDKKVQDAMAKHKIPENCPDLLVPRVNGRIWANIKPRTRSMDLKLQRVQKPLIKGLTAIAKLDQKLSEDVKEGLLLVAHANFELNCLRKDAIKPDLKPSYQHLCKPSNKTTTLLFGDELGKQLKDIQEENKATSDFMNMTSTGGKWNNNRGRGSYARGNRFRPYQRANPNFQHNFQAAAAAAGWTTPSNPFLGTKGNANFKQRQNYRRRQNTPQTYTKMGPSTAPKSSK